MNTSEEILSGTTSTLMKASQFSSDQMNLCLLAFNILIFPSLSICRIVSSSTE